MDLLLFPDYIMDGPGGGMLEEAWLETRLGKRKHWSSDSQAPPSKKLNGEQNSWEQVEELAADLDGSCSLSSLNVDLGTSAFQSSDALLSLPSLSAFKQELLSPFNHNDGGGGETNGQTSPQHHKQIINCYDPGLNGGVDYQVGLSSPQSDGGSSGGSNLVTSAPATSTHTEDCRFQYVLAAATSIATKINEETLTYLNQGQSYEIKLKKLGDLSEYRGKILKSVVRLVFHERRLQYMERQQLAAWEESHPGDSILEVDLPLSYGLLDLSQNLNTIEFLWEPTKEVGVYIKVNCISTEFTPKKHGGEKGVPFRIQVETYLQAEQGVRHLHTASCQVKVFKLKGADRKHKQDREKIQKRPLIEQEKYQCSYDCTILSDVQINGDTAFPPLLLNSANSSPVTSSEVTKLRQVCPVAKEESPPPSSQQPNLTSPCDTSLQTNKYDGVVSPKWSPQEIQAWLQAHRYSAHLQTLSSYCGADLLRLSKENLIQLCGLPDGIRMYNALHARILPPRLTLYLCVEAEREIYEGVYLSERSSWELLGKVAGRVGLVRGQVGGLFLQGPSGLRIAVTDELVAHLPDHAAFTLDVLLSHDTPSDMYQLLLKRANGQSP